MLTWKTPHTATHNDPKYDETTWVSAVIEHGLKDNKGRAIGGYAVIQCRPKTIRTTENGAHRYTLAPEATYFVRTQATRDGDSFGAGWNRPTECKSLDEAQALAAKKIDAAGKRFARQIENGTGRQFKKQHAEDPGSP
jgi:hypothetical protein